MKSGTSKYRYLSKNILIFSLSSFGQKILAFFLVPLYTNILSTAEYGTIDLVSSTVSLLVPIFTINISEAVMRFTITKKEDSNYFSYGIRVVLIGTIILCGGILAFSFTPLGVEYKEILPWICILCFINGIYGLEQNYLRSIDKVSTMVTAGLINSIVMMGLNIVLLTQLKMGMKGYFISLLSGMFVGCIFMTIKGNIISRLSIHINSLGSIRRECIKYSLPTIFTTLSWWINSCLDKYFVIPLVGIAQNGIYSIAYKIPTILGVFQGIFVQAWTLSAITEFDKDDSDGFFGKTYEIYNAMMVLICSIIIVANIFISKILYAKDFFEAWHCVPLLLIACLFSALCGYLGSIFAAVKDTKSSALSTIISAIINIILNSILIPIYGIIGAALATAFSYICAWLIRYIISRKYIKMKISIVRGVVTYVLLFIQTGCAMTESHQYYIQIALIICIVIINFQTYYTAMGQILKKLKKH